MFGKEQRGRRASAGDKQGISSHKGILHVEWGRVCVLCEETIAALAEALSHEKNVSFKELLARNSARCILKQHKWSYMRSLHEGGLRRKSEKEPVQAVPYEENYRCLTKCCMV